jgi:hypothetical protein
MTDFVTDGEVNSMEPHAVLSEYARKRRRARSSSDPVGGQVRDGDPLAGARTYVFDLRWLSPLIRRWKRAVGVVIFQLKMERTQVGVNLIRIQTEDVLTGRVRVYGQYCRVCIPLPRRLTRSTPRDHRRHDCQLWSADLTFGNAQRALSHK